MLLDFLDKSPRVDPTVFIAPNAMVIGDVEIGAGANIWFFTLIRGDVNSITIGPGCNIQDACIIHVHRGGFPAVLEGDVVLGHRVTVHGCHIGHGSLIGIGATVLNGARVGAEAIVGAGSVVTPGTVLPPRTLSLGIPAKPVREITERDLAMIRATRESYTNLMQIYGKSLAAPPQQ
jgi:carbonic anhydrase/acetyltransferase-like protein (isoleucine patch superfamily)